MNLIDTATSLVVANAITQGLGNANLKDFIMGTRDGKYVAGADGSGRLTLPELVTGVNIGSTYAGGTLGGVLKHNLEKNGWNMAGTVIAAPIIANMAKKVLRKPVLTPLNKMIKTTGLNVKV